MDVSMVIERPVTSSTGVAGEEVWEGKTQFIVDDGTLVPNVNDLRLKEFRFSIVPHVQDGGRILLEIGVFERHGNEEVVLSRPRLIALNGENAEVVVGEATLARCAWGSQRKSIRRNCRPCCTRDSSCGGCRISHRGRWRCASHYAWRRRYPVSGASDKRCCRRRRLETWTRRAGC